MEVLLLGLQRALVSADFQCNRVWLRYDESTGLVVGVPHRG